MRISYKPTGLYVTADDRGYLFGKWRPRGSYFLVEMDVAAKAPKATLIGDLPGGFNRPGWQSFVGSWIGRSSAGYRRRARFVIDYVDAYWGNYTTSEVQGVFSDDGASLRFVNGSHGRCC